ncbi:MAG: ion transporter [Chlamydiota bacterium]
MRERIRKRLFDILELNTPGDRLSAAFDYFIITLIILNVVAVALQTVRSIEDVHALLFRRFECFSILVFTAEYLLRLWVCTSAPRYRGAVFGRIRYALSFLGVVDLFAIAPFYIPVILPMDLRFLRVLRLMRVFRMFKLSRYVRSLNVFTAVLKAKTEELVITLFLVLILLMLSSSLMYIIENPVQPAAFSSIPNAMWWAVETLTTVGYGDIYPVTVLGKLLGAVISILGIGLFAIPAGILASGFTEEIRKKRAPVRQCPHCGREIDP